MNYVSTIYDLDGKFSSSLMNEMPNTCFYLMFPPSIEMPTSQYVMHLPGPFSEQNIASSSPSKRLFFLQASITFIVANNLDDISFVVTAVRLVLDRKLNGVVVISSAPVREIFVSLFVDEEKKISKAVEIGSIIFTDEFSPERAKKYILGFG